MHVVWWIWFGFTALAALIWVSRHRQLSIAARVMPPLTARSHSGADGALPSVTWLVAAKDERANIEACLRSLDRQEYPDLRIIAVNDRSTDGTGEIIDRAAAESDRLTAVHVQSLREGWFGKNNAMREGVARAAGEWLCFTDADCVQEHPRSLAIAMREALARKIDFLSVLPAHETRGFWESVIQPACSGIMMIWFNPLKVNDPARPTAYANGAFMLLKRSCYDAIGGHDAVKTELNEDMHMARLAKERGLRLAVVSNAGLYTVRMYDGLAQTINGWSRIFYGCFGAFGRLFASAIMVGLFSLLQWAALFVGAGACLLGRERSGWDAWPIFTAAAGVACLLQWTVMLRFYKLNRLNPLYGLLYPIGAAVGLYALFKAMRRLGGRTAVTWRGTTYRGGRVDVQPS